MLIQRTTLKLNQEVYKLAKKRAIDKEINFQELVNRALKRYLQVEEKETAREKKFRFGDFDLGGLKGKLYRESIYEQRSRANFT